METLFLVKGPFEPLNACVVASECLKVQMCRVAAVDELLAQFINQSTNVKVTFMLDLVRTIWPRDI